MKETLKAMEKAVNDGDRGAYMALVDSTNPELLTEKRAWFADLTSNPVELFSIEPDQVVRYGVNFNHVVIALTYRWTLEVDGIEREMPASIMLKPINQKSDGSWVFAGRDWAVSLKAHESAVEVFADTQNQKLAETSLDSAPQIQSAIESDFEVDLSVPLSIKIYPTMQELQYSIAPGYINPLSGWNEPGESIKILGRESLSEERLSSLLAHEIGHAVSFEFGEEIINAPWWSLEGIAEMMADMYRPDSIESRERRIAKMIAEGNRRSWEQLSDFKGEALNHTTHVYLQGWSMVRYITQRFGKAARNKWFAAMGSGMSVEDACLEALDISMHDLDRDWESAIKQAAQQYADTP